MDMKRFIPDKIIKIVNIWNGNSNNQASGSHCKQTNADNIVMLNHFLIFVTFYEINFFEIIFTAFLSHT